MSVVTTVWVRMFFAHSPTQRAGLQRSARRGRPITHQRKGLCTHDFVITLWQPFTLGRVELPHRLALAPLTRSRANPDGTPGELAAEYYGQRASLGLIITEGTQPSEDGQGYLNTPGIYTPEHIEGWRKIADTVHAGGGALFIQLMHVGRMSHPDNTPHHRRPVGPSAISADQDMVTPTGPQKTPVPRELSADDIQATIAGFRHAAASAIAAGADGVEIHGANGYLLHQFLSPNSNHRTDEYGGSVENRSRFVIEVARAVAEEIGADRTGIRISPAFPLGGINEGDPADVRDTVPPPGRRTRHPEPCVPARTPPR